MHTTAVRTGEILFGYTPEGEAVTIEIRLEPVRGDYETVTHEALPAHPLRLAITGFVYGPRCREAHGAGQILFDAGRVVRGPWSPADRARLLEIWAGWHLNDMQAACEHMVLPEDTSWEARKGIVCAATGYRYGMGWLYRELPADVLADVQRFAAFAGQAKYKRSR